MVMVTAFDSDGDGDDGDGDNQGSDSNPSPKLWRQQYCCWVCGGDRNPPLQTSCYETLEARNGRSWTNSSRNLKIHREVPSSTCLNISRTNAQNQEKLGPLLKTAPSCTHAVSASMKRNAPKPLAKTIAHASTQLVVLVDWPRACRGSNKSTHGSSVSEVYATVRLHELTCEAQKHPEERRLEYRSNP